MSRTSVKCCRYPFWDAVRLGLGGRSLPSCWHGWVPAGRVATVLLREHPSSYDVVSFGMQSFAHVHVPARVFLGRVSTALCWFSVWAGQLCDPSLRTMGRSFPFRSIDGWGSPLPFPRTAWSHVVVFPCPFSFHVPPFRPCVDADLSLSLSLRSARPKRGSTPLPPRAFPLRCRSKRDETLGFFSSSEGKDGLGTFEDVSDRWTPFVR